MNQLNINITLNNVTYINQQTEKYSKSFDSLMMNSTVFESETLGNPTDWDAQAFHENTTTLYSYTIKEGVTKYTGDLAVAVTKDANTGKIFFVWGVYGEVGLGSNQAVVSATAKNVIIRY